MINLKVRKRLFGQQNQLSLKILWQSGHSFGRYFHCKHRRKILPLKAELPEIRMIVHRKTNKYSLCFNQNSELHLIALALRNLECDENSKIWWSYSHVTKINTEILIIVCIALISVVGGYDDGVGNVKKQTNKKDACWQIMHRILWKFFF